MSAASEVDDVDLPDHIDEIRRFLDQCRVDDVGQRVPEATETTHSLSHGTAGIVLFQLELHRATGDHTHLDRAVSAGDAIVADLAGRSFLTCGIYSGWPGHVFVLNELAKASGQPRFADAAVECLERLIGQAEQLGSGIGWVEPMPFSEITGMTGDREVLDLSVGAAGAGIVLLYAHREGVHDKALGWAIAVADRLLEMSVESDDGPNWLMMADMPFPFTASNFAHGGAGVAYFLAELFRETQQQHLLDVAVAAADYVLTQSVPSVPAGGVTSDTRPAFLVRHSRESRPPDLCYLGVCHGPAGTGRLFHLLGELTGDARWAEALDANLRGLLATGAPEVRSDGLWNNFGQCCGDAGIGDFALGLYSATGRADHLDLARRCGAVVLDAGEVIDGGRFWSHAEHRSRPEHLEAQTGYMQGAAGIGSFLLHLATIHRSTPSKIALPESPF